MFNPAAPGFWSDRRVERMLGAVACLVLLLIGGMIAFVFAKAWPSFAHNGLAWFGGGGDVDHQLEDIFNSPSNPSDYVYELHAWPLLWGTFVVTAGAVLIGIVFSLFAAIFIVEFAPPRLSRLLEPVVRLLAAVPSVVYGLIGILVIVPWVGEHLISLDRKESVANVIQLDGASLGVGIMILTIMIVPIMIAIVVDALRAVPRSWTEGASALGVNRWRVTWSIVVRTARPAVVAAAVLATARALGEAIMLSMVSGSASFAPNPIDGITFLFEPTRPLASALVENVEGLTVVPFGQTLFAFAAVLLVSSMFLSLAGFVAKQSMRRYGVQP
ncbi:MAG TPA: phosphate ABC transporter permease subunit PstC [Solirubrobacterales bacterium]|nr:phosphate ABC transporter permease subunit PstC [Solirubrobacterales bacterium]